MIEKTEEAKNPTPPIHNKFSVAPSTNIKSNNEAAHAIIFTRK